ncbi:glycerol-3-phosphate 1-O-acyltransferase PlsY [Glaciecola sp. SC05]|uniref:glycerol-3-phosphate 1-O-acyltransferase PlsY n=1 Tax=Glaciecola sp. SC05 TaxID=1987355 RepID=UPI003528884F
MTTWIVFFMVGAYLGGSISSAVLVCRVFNKADPRTQGSLNPGTTNVLRVAGKSAAALVLMFDILKGAVPTYAAYLLGLPESAIGLIAISACLGHMYPVFFQFKGGKAVATALGAMMPIGWVLTTALISTWLIVFKISKYSSLAAIVTVSLAPLYTYWYKPQFTLAVAMLSLLIIAKHRTNLLRLFSGEELLSAKQKNVDDKEE